MARKGDFNILCLLLIILLCFMYGCVSLNEYGRMRVVSSAKDMLTIERLIREWQGYNIYYADVNPAYPSAILFDPKGDELLLINDKWIAVKEQKELIDLIRWIDLDINFPPDLWAISGPDEQVFGYIYAGWSHVLIKVVNNKTLWVDDSPLPIIEIDDNFLPGQ